MTLGRRYLVDEQLSPALFGAVWRGRDARDSHARVAIKIVSLSAARAALSVHPQLDSPWREQRALALLDRLAPHPHVLRARAFFASGDAWVVVMDLCSGGDLWTALQAQRGARFPESRALALCAQVASALRFLHRNGLAHRDVSLENVLLDARGGCRICDFALAAAAHSRRADRAGKAYYMAPEVSKRQLYDPAAADCWALGVMLFIMLTGSPLAPTCTQEDKSFRAFCAFGVRQVLTAWGMRAMVSDAAVELLEGLLCLEPSKRLTAEAALAHAAFSGIQVAEA